MNYRDLLTDPRWQKKRLEVLQARGFKCEDCFDETTTLHVHHRYYISHRKPWLYPDFCYQVLCAGCHSALHDGQKCEAIEQFEWEEGLNFFGDNIFSLWVDAHEGGSDPVALYAKEISYRQRKEIMASVDEGIAETRDGKNETIH